MINKETPPGFIGWGLWNFEDIKVRVLSERFAQITYSQRVINADTKYINVWLNPIDRYKGMTLESKTKSRLQKLKRKLRQENILILEMREMQKKILE